MGHWMTEHWMTIQNDRTLNHNTDRAPNDRILNYTKHNDRTDLETSLVLVRSVRNSLSILKWLGNRVKRVILHFNCIWTVAFAGFSGSLSQMGRLVVRGARQLFVLGENGPRHVEWTRDKWRQGELCHAWLGYIVTIWCWKMRTFRIWTNMNLQFRRNRVEMF